MTDDVTEIDTPDAFDPELECMAWTHAPGPIGVTTHTHVCRDNPEHDLPHHCHRCEYAWTKSSVAI